MEVLDRGMECGQLTGKNTIVLTVVKLTYKRDQHIL